MPDLPSCFDKDSEPLENLSLPLAVLPFHSIALTHYYGNSLGTYHRRLRIYVKMNPVDIRDSV